MSWKRVARDLVALGALLEMWLVSNRWQVGRGGVVATVLCVLASILLGLSWGYAAHEWGHLAGALLSKSRIRVHDHALSAKLFEFRPSENTRRQFLWMAWGGLVVLWAQAVGFALFLPWGSVGGVVGIGFSVLGAFFTTAIEGPIVLRVSRGGSLPADRSAESGSGVSASAAV